MRHFSTIFLLLLFLFSCNRHLVVSEVNTKNVAVKPQSAPIDPVLDAMIKPYRDSLRIDMNKLVAVSAAPLVKDKPESKLTNLIADIILEFGIDWLSRQNSNIKPDAAYVNYGGIRASLPQGNITVERIFELMPFENEVVLIKISGDSFLQMAEKIANRGGEGIAGIKVGISKGNLASLRIKGNIVDTDASYWLVTNDYIANGGDQMTMFLNPLERINTGMKIREVLIQSLSEKYKKEGIIDVKLDGRIYNEQ